MQFPLLNILFSASHTFVMVHFLSVFEIKLCFDIKEHFKIKFRNKTGKQGKKEETKRDQPPRHMKNIYAFVFRPFSAIR